MSTSEWLQPIQSKRCDGFLIHSVWFNKHDPCSSVPPTADVSACGNTCTRRITSDTPEWNGRPALRFWSAFRLS